MTAARRDELRALILVAVAERGKASLRDLELDVPAGRKTLRAIVAELHRDGLLVPVPGYHGRSAWAIASSAVERGRAESSAVADGQSAECVPTIAVVEPEPTRHDSIAVLRAQLRSLGAPEDMIAAACARSAEIHDRAHRHAEMLIAIAEALDLDRDEALAIFDDVGNTDRPEHEYLAAISAALVRRGHSLTFAGLYTGESN